MGGYLKRQHQKDFETVIDSIIDGSSIKKILCKVTPGGGKSALPIITGKLIGAGLVDKILWICPRMSLQSQGERNFIDPFFREMFDHNLSIRQSTNEPDPCRGLDGFITTYQAIAADASQTIRTVLPDVRKYRYAVILDEFHHVDVGGEWSKALARIVAEARYLVLMTGTLERGDNRKISYIEYTTSKWGSERPTMIGDHETAVILYERSAALEDHAILPLHFVFSDGKAAWENYQGREIHSDSFYEVLPKERSAALYAALSTEFAEQLLALALGNFIEYLELVPSAKMLVVTAGITEARRHFKTLVENSYAAGLATSHETAEAIEQIDNFRLGRINILVTIAMAYEGLDIPEISHTACLTHIRSKPWIEQMFARAVRINKFAGPWGDQIAYIFSPDDMLMRAICEEIEREQTRAAGNTQARVTVLKRDPSGQAPKIIPLSSSTTTQREARLDAVETPKQREEALLRDIENHVRRFTYANRLQPGEVNSQLFQEFGKPRRSMRFNELERLFDHIQNHFPLGRPVRGTGITRESPAVTPVQSNLFSDGMGGFKY
jgi:superfamily II DNA or RNA helicase